MSLDIEPKIGLIFSFIAKYYCKVDLIYNFYLCNLYIFIIILYN